MFHINVNIDFCYIFHANQEQKQQINVYFLCSLFDRTASPETFNLLFSESQQSSSASSTPQKSSTARTFDPYQCNYIRMERKFKTAMRKVTKKKNAHAILNAMKLIVFVSFSSF